MKNLSGQVEQLTDKAQVHRRAQSTSDISSANTPPSSSGQELSDMVIIEREMAEQQPLSKIRYCHHCHAPTDDPGHVGVPCGVGRCSLDHWQGCAGDIRGGKDSHGKVWTGCDGDSSSTDEDDSQPEEEEDNEKVNAKKHLPKTVAEAAKSLGFEHDEVSESDSDDEEIRLQEEELAKLKAEVELNAALMAARAARSTERQLKKAKRKEDLARELQLLREKQATMAAMSGAGAAGYQSTGARNKDLKDKVSEHEAKKARKASAKLAKQSSQDANITMAGIRSIPHIRRDVDSYITHIKLVVPPLSSDPTAGGFITTPLLHPKQVEAQNKTPATKYVYVEELGQDIPVVESLKSMTPSTATPVPAHSPAAAEVIDSSDSESECSEDEFCPFNPDP